MTLEEAREIMSDPQHPQHVLYKQGDPIVTSEVDKAFERTFGAHEVEIEKITIRGKNG